MLLAAAPRDADHFIGNVHSDDAAFRHDPRNPPRKPSRATAHVQHVFRRRQPHLLHHRQRDRQMVSFHSFAAPGFGPAVELFAQILGVGFGHRFTSHFMNASKGVGALAPTSRILKKWASAPGETLRSPANPFARQVPVARSMPFPGCLPMTSEYQTVRPHAVQKCAPEWANVPHWQQNRPPAGTATSLNGLYGSAVRAQIRAIIQPITVHPRNRLTRMIPAASRLSRPIMVGRKYRKTRKSRVSTGHPFHFDLGAADTPARLLPLIRMRRGKCFPSLRIAVSPSSVFLTYRQRILFGSTAHS